MPPSHDPTQPPTLRPGLQVNLGNVLRTIGPELDDLLPSFILDGSLPQFKLQTSDFPGATWCDLVHRHLVHRHNRLLLTKPSLS